MKCLFIVFNKLKIKKRKILFFIFGTQTLRHPNVTAPKRRHPNAGTQTTAPKRRHPNDGSQTPAPNRRHPDPNVLLRHGRLAVANICAGTVKKEHKNKLRRRENAIAAAAENHRQPQIKLKETNCC